MRILLVNDDGLYAKGIVELAKALKDKHDVTVIAPDRECSGMSHNMHFLKPVCYKEEEGYIDGCRCYKISGTPCDSPKVGIGLIMRDNPPDFVISGINNGLNVAKDVIYSGTVNAAIEAAANGVKAIAVSVGGHSNDYAYPCKFIVNNLDKLYNAITDTSVILSINFPHSKEQEIKGIKYVKVGVNKFDDRYQPVPPHVDGYNNAYMLTGNMFAPPDDGLTSDITAVFAGYIAVSPIKAEFTHTATLTNLAEAKLCK